MSRTLQGHHTKLNKTKTNKKAEVLTVSSRRQTSYTVQYNYDRL